MLDKQSGPSIAHSRHSDELKRMIVRNIASYERKAIEASANYSDICNITRNKSWDAWLTKNNNEVNSKMIWQRIKRCSGTIQRPPQHPDPIQESNRLLSEFAPNDTAYKRWSKLCRTSPPPAMGARFTVFGHAGHADPLDGWRCCSQKRVMSRPIQVRQL